MSLKITSPARGATVSGIVPVLVSSPDVQRVNFSIDGVVKGRDLARPFLFDWYTTRYAEGSHTIKAVSGNGKQFDEVTVTVKNAVAPPPLTESPDNTVVVGLSGKIVGKGLHTWAINASGLVVVDGVADASTWGVLRLAYEKGVVWQENQNHLWWGKVLPSDTWTPAAGTATSPIPGALAVTITGTPTVGKTLTAVTQ